MQINYQCFGYVPIAACKHHAIEILHIMKLNLPKPADVAPKAVVVCLARKSRILRAHVLERCLDAVWVEGGADYLAWTGTRRIVADQAKTCTACCVLLLPVYGSTYVTPGIALTSASSAPGPPYTMEHCTANPLDRSLLDGALTTLTMVTFLSIAFGMRSESCQCMS